MQFLSNFCLCMRGALRSTRWGVLCMTRWDPWYTPSLPHQPTSHRYCSYCTEEAALHEEISEHARYVHFSAVLPLWATLSKLVACCGQEMHSLLEPLSSGGSTTATKVEFRCMTVKLVLQYGEKLRGVQEEQRRTQNTYLRYSWHHVNQFAPTTIHHDILRPISESVSEQNRQAQNQLPQSSDWREFPIGLGKSCIKVDLNNSNLLLPLESIL